MKIELKHLAPYLPYGLKYLINPKDVSDNFKNEQRIKEMSTTSIDLVLQFGKPILQPVSEYLFNKLPITTDMLMNALKYGELPVKTYNDMIENHFDVFGLIDAGLAIDINTIQPCD